MKIFRIAILSLFGLFLLAVIFLESGFGNRVAANLLVRILARSGLHVEVESLSGNFPKTIAVSHARVDGVFGKTLLIDEMHMEIALLPLLGGDIEIERLEVDRVEVEEGARKSQGSRLSLPMGLLVKKFHVAHLKAPNFPEFSATGHGSLRSRDRAAFLNIDVQTADGHAHAILNGTLDSFTGTIDGGFKGGTFNAQIQKKRGQGIRLQNIAVSTQEFKIQGLAHVTRSEEGFEINAQWTSPRLAVIDQASGQVHGHVDKELTFKGAATATGHYLGETWTLKTEVAHNKSSPVALNQLELHSAMLSAHGNLTMRPDAIWDGSIAIESGMFGSVYGEVHFGASAQTQEISASLNAVGVHWKRLYLERASLSSFGKQVHIELQNSGAPFELTLDGVWQYQPETGLLLSLESAQGILLSHPLYLYQPATFSWRAPNDLSLDPFRLAFGNGFINATLRREKGSTNAQLQLNNVPIDLFSLNPLHANVEGALNADLVWKEQNGKQDADMTLELKNGRVEAEGAEPIMATASLKGALHKERLAISGKFDVQERPLLELQLETPLKGDGKISGMVKAQGQIEELFDFFNFGMHRLEGVVACDLTFSGTLAAPHVEGSCRIVDGFYQNYLTGTELTHITGALNGEGSRLVLPLLTAQDYRGHGEFVAAGDILFSVKEDFPFHFDTRFSRFSAVQIDLVDAEMRGDMSIHGNLHSAKATGLVEVVESMIQIPDKVPRSYPELQVTYKNGLPPAEILPQETMPLPLELSLHVQAPEGIYIEGRGLNSEWKGNFLVEGTFAEPAITGKLELVDGEFNFAGRRFDLVDGSLSLQGNEYKMPLLDISAHIAEKGVSITARVRGPLNHPQITFQSVPPLPLTSILSHLLFGKDLSDVNGLQALQLAGTVASVAGEGPDILEITRKALGVDRLQIVMTPSASGTGEGTVTLQVGKVLTPGLVIIVRQGADDKNPSIAIEVDLTHGFTFEGESQQQPEQGKFSLKWNVNY